MKKIYITTILTGIIALTGIMTATAGYINPLTRIRLKNNIVQSRNEYMPYQPILIMVADEQTVDQLADYGVIVYYRRGDILLTSVPTDNIEAVLSLKGIVCTEISGDLSSNMNKARPFGTVDIAQAGGEGLPMGYDGTGVVIGFTDIGFDPHHIAFRDRVSAIYDFKPQQGIVKTATTPQEIAEWYTDEIAQGHATHVANILGGDYRGNEYYGVATGGEMVATTSDLTDVGILSGVEAIIEYAQAHDKPAVINISLGNSLGPHDGSDLFCQYLSRCSDDAIICLSAGNNGDSDMFAYKQLTNDTDISRVTVNSSLTWNGFDVLGMTDIWSQDDTPFSCRIEVYDLDTKSIVYASPWIGSEHSEQSIIITDENDTEWSAYFSGKVIAECGTSILNNRYNVTVMYDTHTKETAQISNGRWSRYMTSLAIKGGTMAAEHKTMAYIFADSHLSYITALGIGSPVTMSHSGSISDLCTADGIVSVGACNSRNTAPALYGEEQHWDFELDNVANFSSYSDIEFIPRLPHICAPGNYVVSAASTPFLECVTAMNHLLVSITKVDGDNYFWIAECGTSMASPYVAGVIAMWLQADPTLTSKQAIEIARATALTDYPDINNPRWGAGCINAIGGLLSITATNPSLSLPKPLISIGTDRILTVHNATDNISLYTISGTKVSHHEPLSPGIYVLSVPGCETQKIVVR